MAQRFTHDFTYASVFASAYVYRTGGNQIDLLQVELASLANGASFFMSFFRPKIGRRTFLKV